HDSFGFFPQGGKVFLSNTNWDQEYDKGIWHVHILPYMEQSPEFNMIPDLNFMNFKNLSDPFNDSILAAGNIDGGQGYFAIRKGLLNPPATPFTLPYQRCPSDGTADQAMTSNYVGSLGPACVASPCSFAPD